MEIDVNIQKESEAFDLWWEGNAIAMMCEEDEALKIWQAAKAQAVPEGCVVLKVCDVREIISNASDAMDDESPSTVFIQTGSPSTWYDYYLVAERNILDVIEAQESTND